TRIGSEVDFQRGIELKVSAERWVVDVIHSKLEVVVVPGLRDIVLELPLPLERLLRNVCVSPKAGTAVTAVVAATAGESDKWHTNLAVNYVVPILETKGEAVDGRIGQRRVQRQIRKLQVIEGKVSGGRILESV